MSKRFAISTLISATDQALLSLFSLAISLAFIRGANKAEFATFTLCFVAVQLMQSVQNALVSSPLLTLMPARSGEHAKTQVLEAGLSFQRHLMAGVGLTSIGFCAGAWLAGSFSLAMLIGATGLAALGVMSRELVRAVQFIRQAPQRALAGDAAYVTRAAAGMLGAFIADRLSAPTVLAVLGLAGLSASLAMALAGMGVRTRSRAPGLPVQQKNERVAVWGCARWALPSVVISWTYANAFLFAVEAWMGKGAVADISAARLLLVPLSLLMMGWTMTFRPKAATWLVEGDAERLHRTAVVSVWMLLLASLGYGALLIVAWQPILLPLLGPAYAEIEVLVAMWLLVFTISNVRCVGMNAMLASAGAYRTLFFHALAGTVAAALGIAAALAVGSVWAVLAALILSEGLMSLLAWCHGWPAIRRSAGAPRQSPKHD